MNTHIEDQLRSLKPRRPSARLKRRIFSSPAGVGADAAAAAESSGWDRLGPGLWRWMAPAMAMFMMLLGLSAPNSGAFTQLISGPMVGRISALALKEPDMATYCLPFTHSDHNGWKRATFQWTNRSRSVTTTDSVLGGWATNNLRH